MPDPLSAQTTREWRILWESDQETVGFTSREAAEEVLHREQGLLRGTLQVRGPWEDVTTTMEDDA
jgi:hypothetical protein